MFCSTKEQINITKLFKIVLAKAFDLKCTIRKISSVSGEIVEPLLEFD